MGPGARLVVKVSGGGGALVWGHPFSNYLGYTSNGRLFKARLCWGGGGGGILGYSER